jgi:hypothetical protein
MEHDPEITLRDVEPPTNFIVWTFLDFVELKHLGDAGW